MQENIAYRIIFIRTNFLRLCELVEDSCFPAFSF